MATSHSVGQHHFPRKPGWTQAQQDTLVSALQASLPLPPLAVSVPEPPHRQIDLTLAGELTLETGDQGTLRQVFTNLVENAVKYSPAGTPVEVTAEGDGERIIVTVAECGPCIPLDEREVIFERFRRGKNHAEQGTGIGLYLVRALVAAHGGTVHVSDRPDGEGALFVAYLPVRRAPEEITQDAA